MVYGWHRKIKGLRIVIEGRGVVATRDFKTDDTIFEEEPLVCCQFSWNAAYGYLACDHCMRPLETTEENVRRLTMCREIVLPFTELCPTNKTAHSFCPSCHVQYCSEKCKATAWEQYHRTLCQNMDYCHPLHELNEEWKKIHYPPETTTIMLLARIVALVEQAADKEAILNCLKEFSHSKFDGEETDMTSVANRLLGLYQEQIQHLHTLFVQAVPAKTMQQWLTLEGFSSLLAIVGANGQGVGTSVFSQWVDTVTSKPELDQAHLDEFIKNIYDKMEECVGLAFLNNEGSGLYYRQRFVNHSCEPNAVITFPLGNSTLRLKALKDIAAGEEICTSYIEVCELERSRHSRQKMLRENYFYICHCKKCLSQAGDPDVTSEEEECSDEEEEDAA
ncbi:hypothetical protein LSTR_LSTR015362 [Laodelphax striatellus]|uniref:SET domain-containing protein n=1 Tax=Laodelphax striatellus TaxID=195883 RepID=A0A482WJM9_LAOST|nr:hypothetical protein LSTR_LSTR015362 [Laodelphax striatellus]